jgi:hypothetical protein
LTPAYLTPLEEEPTWLTVTGDAEAEEAAFVDEAALVDAGLTAEAACFVEEAAALVAAADPGVHCEYQSFCFWHA